MALRLAGPAALAGFQKLAASLFWALPSRSPAQPLAYAAPGRRTSDWLKIKARLQQEFVAGGFTKPKGSRKHLGAVIIGAYTVGKLRHYGYAGSGFSGKGLKEAVERMKPFFYGQITFR